MKATITGFFDRAQDLERTIEIVKENKLTHIALRRFKGRSLIEMSDAEIKELQAKLRSERIDISIIDTAIKPYDVTSKSRHAEALDAFKYMIKLSTKLKVDYLFLELPQFHDVIEAYPDIERCLIPFVEQALINRKRIVINPTPTYNTNVYAYILKKMKTDALMVAYDPVLILQNGESTTTSYRLLKKYIAVFIAKDAHQDGTPELLGYGQTDMLNIFKRFIRDRYQGFVFADHDFTENFLVYQPHKVSFFKRVLGHEKKRIETNLQTLQKRLFPEDPQHPVTLDDILDNQIKVLRVVFK